MLALHLLNVRILIDPSHGIGYRVVLYPLLKVGVLVGRTRDYKVILILVS